MDENGIVFDISRFSLYDGNGIRTTVFLKGCPLRCKWCHNPESQKLKPQLRYIKNKCISCRKCKQVCINNVHDFNNDEHIINFENCNLCYKCVENCTTEALEIVGEKKTVDEVIHIVLKDKPFYESSGGGLTISGGEPFLQFEFMLALLKKAKQQGINTCVETCGYADKELIKKALPFIDLFLYDYKLTSEEKHIEYTGVSNKKILENLDFICKMKSEVVLRCPIIPGVNDNSEHFKNIAALCNKYDEIIRAELMPYHNLGLGKAESIGVKEYFDTSVPENEDKNKWIEEIQSYGCTKVKIG